MLYALTLLRSSFFKYVAIAGSVLAIVGYIYAQGREAAVEDIREKERQEFVDTTKRIQNAPTSTTRDAAIEQLRNMGDLR